MLPSSHTVMTCRRPVYSTSVATRMWRLYLCALDLPRSSPEYWVSLWDVALTQTLSVARTHKSYWAATGCTVNWHADRWKWLTRLERAPLSSITRFASRSLSLADWYRAALRRCVIHPHRATLRHVAPRGAPTLPFLPPFPFSNAYFRRSGRCTTRSCADSPPMSTRPTPKAATSSRLHRSGAPPPPPLPFYQPDRCTYTYPHPPNAHTRRRAVSRLRALHFSLSLCRSVALPPSLPLALPPSCFPSLSLPRSLTCARARQVSRGAILRWKLSG